MSFSQLPAVKKDTIFGAAQAKLGSFYFVKALGLIRILFTSGKPKHTPKETLTEQSIYYLLRRCSDSSKGPSINNVGNFSEFLTPPSPISAVF